MPTERSIDHDAQIALEGLIAQHQDRTAAVLAFVRVAAFNAGFFYPQTELSPGETVGIFVDRLLAGVDKQDARPGLAD